MLYGKKTRLRRIEREDIPTYVRWFNDPEVREFLAVYLPMSTAEEEGWFQRQLEDPNSEVFAIETSEGVHIGSIGLHGINWQCSSAELGIMIGEKDYWGKGYGSDAMRVLLRFVFDEMNLHRVYLRVREDNARGISAYEKCGFQLEGRMREAVYNNGRYYDQVWMGILRKEFERQPAAVAHNQRTA